MTASTDTPLDENARRYYLDVMGIQCWELLSSADEIDNSAASHQHSSEDAVALLSDLEVDVQQCCRCQLHQSRKQAIVGRGNVSAGLMFVLISPDSNDDANGMLCSGEANALFTKMLAAINIDINHVYITSLLKCSVPARHTISTTELHHCKDYLIRQINLLQPKMLVVLGETAAQCILQKDAALDELRQQINAAYHSASPVIDTGDIEKFESVPLFVSYSPHELMLKPGEKRKAWHDLQQLQKLIRA